MDAAKIDWKILEWKFVEDQLYEYFNAPNWFDFLSLNNRNHADDDAEAWFCTPNCKHPKTAEDFLRSKAFSSGGASEILPLGDQNRRDVKLKRRVRVPAINQDSENQNPNLFTSPNNLIKPLKVAVKSSEEKKKLADNSFQNNKVPSLRSNLSAKDLFAGQPILSQITEFCNELKKLATRTRGRENDENLRTTKSEKGVEKAPAPVQTLGESDGREKERKALVGVGKGEGSEESCVKGKQQMKKRPDEAENRPICFEQKNLRYKGEKSLPQIRTNPPSPQCFCATHGLNISTPSKASESKLMESGILKGVEQNKKITKESSADNSQGCKALQIIDGREAKALDMFWFLKPCTLSG